jgi:S1-C subfamily serine protease
MRKPIVFATIIVFAVAIIIIIPFGTFIVQPTAIAAQHESNSSSSQNTNSSSSQNTNSSSAASTSSPLKTIFKQVEDSVIQITSKIPTGLPPQSENAALGSGFLYDKQGHIVTNGHIVGNAKIVDVRFVDGNRYTAKVVASDIYSDIAVIQISQNITQQQQQQLSSLKPLIIGNSSELVVGNQVIAIGNPFGLSDTVTTGIVGGLGRLLPAGAGFSIPNTIQTDAPINPGNSGGPLLNIQGELIGMNTAIFSGRGTFPGIGFAIPSNTMTRIVPTLIEKGYFVHPYLGLKGGSLTSDLAENLTGIPLATHLSGIYVDTITKDGPADNAGVRGSITDQYSKKHAGDIIIAVDGRKVIRIDDLGSYIDQHKSVGDNITLTVYRNGHTIDLKTTLTPRPSTLPSPVTRSEDVRL